MPNARRGRTGCCFGAVSDRPPREKNARLRAVSSARRKSRCRGGATRQATAPRFADERGRCRPERTAVASVTASIVDRAKSAHGRISPRVERSYERSAARLAARLGGSGATVEAHRPRTTGDVGATPCRIGQPAGSALDDRSRSQEEAPTYSSTMNVPSTCRSVSVLAASQVRWVGPRRQLPELQNAGRRRPRPCRPCCGTVADQPPATSS